jgi:hypothetical protein
MDINLTSEVLGNCLHLPDNAAHEDMCRSQQVWKYQVALPGDTNNESTSLGKSHMTRGQESFPDLIIEYN